MKSLRRYWPLLLLLLPTACDDPSNVGLGLVEEQTQPEVRTFTPSLFEPTPLKDVTGATTRVLAGQVDDPLAGMLAATAYVDFLSTFNNEDNPTINGAALRLAPDYVYGDTTLTVTLNLFDLVEDWSSTDAPADTTLPKGPLVTSFDLPPGDTLVTVPLPDAWVAANDTTLRSPTFEASFHGFALEGAGSSAIVGIDAPGSALLVYTDSDTVAYSMARRISGLARLSEPTLPPNRILVQDGFGPTISFNFPFEEAGLDETPLNGAVFRFSADTTAIRDTPLNFNRPVQRRLQLVGVNDEGEFFVLADETISENGYVRFNAPPTLNVITLRELLQRTLFGEDLFDHFELRTPREPNTINVVLLHDTTATAKVPEALLTITPTGN